ncbi:hypothetical protein LINPERPRIM_LOCUS29811 [Linum perenne]
MQMRREEENSSRKMEQLPMESSPYMKYSNLEEYKAQAYGTQGHQAVKTNQATAASSTDAPTQTQPQS